MGLISRVSSRTYRTPSNCSKMDNSTPTNPTEDKLLTETVEKLHARVSKLQKQISTFLTRMHEAPETVNWPVALEQFGIITSEVEMLLKAVSNTNYSNIHNQIVLPLELSPEPHPDLIKFTERRIPFFNHEVVPNLLRTKLDPSIEERDLKIHEEAFRKYQTVENLTKAVEDMLRVCKKHKTKIDKFEKDSNNNSSNDLNHAKHKINTSN